MLLNLIIIPILFVVITITIVKKLYIKENLKHFFRNNNKNYIPDGVEDIVGEVEGRIERVKEEIEDVKESAADLKEQVIDVVEAAKGSEKKRRGRPKKTK